VRGTIHPERQARDHADAGLAERLRELACIGFALRCGVAAAHDGQAPRMVQGLHVAKHVEHQRRVGHLQQFARVAGVAECEDVAVFTLGQPGQQPVHLGIELVGDDFERVRCARADDGLPRR
jgi:hypothetical protein